MPPRENSKWKYLGWEEKNPCHLFSCWIFLKEAVAECTFVSISGKQPLLLMPECSTEHLHLFVLWGAFGQLLFCPSKLVRESALSWSQAQWNHEVFDSFLMKTCLRGQLQIKSGHRDSYLHHSYCNVEPSVDYSRTCPSGCWWDSAGIYQDLASQVEVKTLCIQSYPRGSGETARQSRMKQAASQLHYHKRFLFNSLRELSSPCISSQIC